LDNPDREVDIRYGGESLSLALPATTVVDEYAPQTVAGGPTCDDFAAEVKTRGLGGWFDLERPLLVVNDGYRSTPTGAILGWLDRYDSTILDRAEILIATGTHAAPTEQHLATIFGEYLDRVRSRLVWHDARDRESMTMIGRDKFDGEVWLNRIAAERDCILAISSVEPHYFAGFTGGRKSFFPGLTDLATIERNHNLANSLEARPMRLKGNPVAEHLDELTSLLAGKNLLGIQAVLDATGRIASVCCGSLSEAFDRGVLAATGIFGHRAEMPYDMVIAEMLPPLDGNLYQLQKALENCQAGVADGGSIILMSACSEGIGSEHFFELARKWDREANQPCDGVLRFGSHKLSRVISISHRCEIRLHSEMPDKEVRRVFYEPLDKVREFVLISLSKKRNSRVAVVRDAGNTVLTS
jgi:nickel-dependent lactate racemase